MSATVRVAILTGYGINADVELGQAFAAAGAQPRALPVSDLLSRPPLLRDVQVLGVPGGFSFGDHLGSGRVLAQLLRRGLKDELKDFVDRGGLVLGVCNGFQVLVKLGMLPNLGGGWTPEATLIGNEGGRFQDRWVGVRYNPRNTSPWLTGLGDADLPIRHGEGRFVSASAEVRQALHDRALVALTYRGANPNGAEDAIAGLTDPTGRVFGLMPHPEAYQDRLNHPLWRRRPDPGPLGLEVFRNAVRALA